ncbi:ORF1 [Simian torque teno virus 30]|uniref:Capsid protein n=1 Tax=Simian torque teno virus 30 TaxID=1619218 RepID=A0A0C5IA78_9VIRU|nr:ORF1 [Simian torque teno virus 30]AJP36584.1 ORF1 [Simian torque teno virus 30]
MPYWWRRRRRRWPRRRRWTRYRRRRWMGRYKPRRATRRRRRRRRRTVRRRFSGYTRRATRRRGRRRRRLTVTLKQWKPETLRSLRVTGLFPLIVCGSGASRNNWIQRSFDVPGPDTPIGGNLSVSVWTMRVLYEEWQLHRNNWSRTNSDLDLVMYYGCTLKFWRHPYVDYIVKYIRNTPFKTEELTHAAGHPMVLMLSKHHVVVPSLLTKPHGRRWIKVTVRPPRMLTSKFYFQSDFCNVNLLGIVASACKLNSPWLEPDKITPCITFYALKNTVFKNQNITEAQNAYTALTAIIVQNKEMAYNTWLEHHWGSFGNGKAFNITNVKDNSTLTQNQINTLRQTAENTFKSRYNFIYEAQPPTTFTYYNLHGWGLYSPLWLDPDRIEPESEAAFLAVRYNPLNDKGEGNWVALQPLTKELPILDDTCKMVLKDYPLWLILYGYPDAATKILSGSSPLNNTRLIIRCQYTDPPLAFPQATDYKRGYTIYSRDFATGRMPGGNTFIPITTARLWYPRLQNQLDVVEAIVNCGPLMPRDDLHQGWAVTMGYKYRFQLGGNLPPKQDPVDPCKVPKRELPDPSAELTAVQIVDPATMDPLSTLHPWDYRRSMLTSSGIKRMSADRETDSSLYPGATGVAKRPKTDVPTQKGEEPGPGERLREVLQSLLEEQQQETEDPPSPPPGERVQQPELFQQLALRYQLQQQRERQGKLAQGIKYMFQQLIKTQQGVQVDPRLL